MLSETLLLASASPRRVELISSIGLAPLVEPVDFDERSFDELAVPLRVIALAEGKSRLSAATTKLTCRWILGADTLVELDGRTLGKPQDEQEARQMILELSGRTHTVATGLCLLDRRENRIHTIASETKVSFARMSEIDISNYIRTGEWRGAAGAYRIQQTAAIFVERIEGSFTGVVGLPLREFYVILLQSAFPVPFGREGATDCYK